MQRCHISLVPYSISPMQDNTGTCISQNATLSTCPVPISLKQQWDALSSFHTTAQNLLKLRSSPLISHSWSQTPCLSRPWCHTAYIPVAEQFCSKSWFIVSFHGSLSTIAAGGIKPMTFLLWVKRTSHQVVLQPTATWFSQTLWLLNRPWADETLRKTHSSSHYVF